MARRKVKADDAFERWWKRYEPGVPLSDAFEVAVVHEHARLAFLAGIRLRARNRVIITEDPHD